MSGALATCNANTLPPGCVWRTSQKGLCLIASLQLAVLPGFLLRFTMGPVPRSPGRWNSKNPFPGSRFPARLLSTAWIVPGGICTMLPAIENRSTLQVLARARPYEFLCPCPTPVQAHVHAQFLLPCHAQCAHNNEAEPGAGAGSGAGAAVNQFDLSNTPVPVPIHSPWNHWKPGTLPCILSYQVINGWFSSPPSCPHWPPLGGIRIPFV